MQYPAIVVANEIIKLAKAQEIPLTPMKLQKILYLANGISYKRFNDKLIKERFEAWDYGPVVPSVYNNFKMYGSNDIKDPSDEILYADGNKYIYASSISVDDDSLKVIREAWDSAKNLDAFTLSAWSHNKNSPWDKAYNAKPKEPYISDEEIKKYFDAFITE
jgi:uncharacterized phage-associated protein